MSPATARDTISRMIATLEWASQVRPAATTRAINGSLGQSAEHRLERTEEFRIGSVVATIEWRASSIRPRPIAARPRSRCRDDLPAMNVTTPTRTNSGDSQSKRNDSAWTTSEVPTSAPSITASAGAVAISPRSAKDAVISAVAVLLCRMPVTPSPAPNAASRWRSAWPMIRRRSPP